MEKYNSIKWGGNGATGARSIALKAAQLYKFAGYGLIAVGTAASLTQAYYNGGSNRDGAKFGASVIMTGIGLALGGPVGLAVGLGLGYLDSKGILIKSMRNLMTPKGGRIVFFDYLFYCHYILFEKLRKGDFPEVKAVVVMGSSNCCLLLTLIFISGNFSSIITSTGVAVFVCAIIMIAYFLYFVHNDSYKYIIQNYSNVRDNRTVLDIGFASIWTLFNYFAVFIYVALAY
jgi:hypothetical protein